MDEDKKMLTRYVDGQLYYIPDYVNFLYKNLEERDNEIARLNNIINEFESYLQLFITGAKCFNDGENVELVLCLIDKRLKELKGEDKK